MDGESEPTRMYSRRVGRAHIGTPLNPLIMGHKRKRPMDLSPLAALFNNRQTEFLRSGHRLSIKPLVQVKNVLRRQ